MHVFLLHFNSRFDFLFEVKITTTTQAGTYITPLIDASHIDFVDKLNRRWLRRVIVATMYFQAVYASFKCCLKYIISSVK